MWRRHHLVHFANVLRKHKITVDTLELANNLESWLVPITVQLVTVDEKYRIKVLEKTQFYTSRYLPKLPKVNDKELDTSY